MLDRYRRIAQARDRAQTDEDGFTLIELLIVIVVLGILAAVTVFGLTNISGQSLTSACHADAKSVAVAQEAFKAQNGVYSPDVQSLLGGATSVTTVAGTGPYLRTLPGNTNKYLITTVNGTTAGSGQIAGHVYVAHAATPGTEVDFENFTGTDPCTGL